MDIWTELGSLPPRELTGARLEIHHALQLPAIAVGRSLLEARDDDSHTALTWLDVPAEWVSGAIPAHDLRAGLRPADLVLTLGGRDDPAESQFTLIGRSRRHGLEWLRDQLARHGVDGERATLDIHYDLPSHPVADGVAFSHRSEAARVELARYFSAASTLLSEIVQGEDASPRTGASPIRTWPHHFDMATLIQIGDADGGKSVGVGLSPGDGTYDEPYFYVSPHPRPDEGYALPDLPSGHWHTDDFFAAVLTASHLLDSDDPGGRAHEMITAALAASREMLA